jgi:preprotein translocase subunit SecD
VQNQPVVNYNLQGSSVDDWCNYTTKHNTLTGPCAGHRSIPAIVLDGKVISDPNVQGPICGAGGIQISG